MFTNLRNKFELGEKVKLRSKINAYVKGKAGTFSKGHEFEVVDYFINFTQKQVTEAFAEDCELIEPAYIYELKDSDGRQIYSYVEDLKKVEIVEAQPVDDEEEEIDEEETPKVAKISRFVSRR